jgi:hypothetical protein
MSVVCEGITFYDPREAIKAEAAEAIGYGESCYVSTDGKAYLVDNGKSDVCHGWALKAVAAGTKVTLVRECRMDVGTTQTIGARAYTGGVAGGSAPSTTLAATGVVVGFAVSATKLSLRAPMPAADG